MTNSNIHATSDIAPFAPAESSMAAKVEQDMQKRFLQHFETANFSSHIASDHAEWLETPSTHYVLRFNVCERVASKMDDRQQAVWVAGERDRGRAILQRLGLEITDAPDVVFDELNPHKCAIEYTVDLADKSVANPHAEMQKIGKALEEATKYYYNARKDALSERGEEYVEPTAMVR